MPQSWLGASEGGVVDDIVMAKAGGMDDFGGGAESDNSFEVDLGALMFEQPGGEQGAEHFSGNQFCGIDAVELVRVDFP